MSTVDNCWTIFSDIFKISIWKRLWSTDGTNRIRWRLNELFQVRPFSGALQIDYGVGTNNVATFIIVKVSRNK